MPIPMEKRRYRGKATKWEWTEAKTGTPQLVIDFEITQGEFKGERASDMFSLTDNTYDWFFTMLRTLGWTGTDLDAITDLDANEVELGMSPEDVKDDKGQIKHDENGEVQRRLRIFVNKGGLSERVEALDPNKKKALAAKFKNALAAFDAKARGGRSAAPPKSNGTAPSGPPPGHPAAVDDIPF